MSILFPYYQLLVPLRGREVLLLWCRTFWMLRCGVGFCNPSFRGPHNIFFQRCLGLGFFVIEVGVVPNDTIVLSFRFILVYAQRGASKSMDFCCHFVYASWFDWTHVVSTSHLIISKPFFLLSYIHSYFGSEVFQYKVVLSFIGVDDPDSVDFGFPFVFRDDDDYRREIVL